MRKNRTLPDHLNRTFLYLTLALLSACGQSKDVNQSFYQNGQLQQEIEYENGVPNGKLTSYYPSGKIKSTGFFKNGQLDSTSTSFYEDGKIRSTKTYRNGLAEGSYQNYHENGHLIGSGQYTKGVRTGYAYEYFREYPGKVKKKTYYYNFQGKEQIGYVVTYQPEGQVDEINPGKVLVRIPGDTLRVGEAAQLEFSLANADQELQAVVLGGYNDEFQPTDNLKADTTKAADGKKALIRFTPTKPGLNPVRGTALVKLMSVQSGNTRQITVKPFYFEYPLYAK
jgi:hypothetical protein